MKIVALAILFAASLCVGCAPSPNDSTSANTSIDSAYHNNISTLYGYGGKVSKDSSGQEFASNIIWRDSNGVERSLTDLKGKVIVLNFWATWCTYCDQEMPDLQSISDSLSSQGLQVVGVSVDVGNSIFNMVQTYIDVKKITFQIVIDPKAITYFNYGGSGSTLPWTYFIDRNLKIRYIFEGEPSKLDFLKAIATIL